MTLDEKFAALARLGAGGFAHINGSLEEHLIGTHARLESWGADPVLLDAALFHAAYGTDHFGDNMVSLDQRERIAGIIGEEAEALVYLYCSCDRGYTWPRIGTEDPVRFRDRFADRIVEIAAEDLRDFCELAVANENDIAARTPSFLERNRETFRDLFGRMEGLVSPHATADARDLYGGEP
ncbi:MAG: hypothetical protein GC201_14260 [Alphaproteobacteria bacterium]|nr:hypothetical protein [Alphaproteobacteria bacterium]